MWLYGQTGVWPMVKPSATHHRGLWTWVRKKRSSDVFLTLMIVLWRCWRYDWQQSHVTLYASCGSWQQSANAHAFIEPEIISIYWGCRLQAKQWLFSLMKEQILEYHEDILPATTQMFLWWTLEITIHSARYKLIFACFQENFLYTSG